MIIYPDKPWYDGQEFEHTTSEGQKLVGTYDEAHKTWFFRDFRLASDLVFTDTVYTVNMKPSQQSISAVASTFDDTVPLPDPGQFTTQQDVNWYLYDLIADVEGRPPIISDTEPTEHPKFPGERLQEGDFWIDNHEGRAFTTMYYWTGTEWEEIEDAENFDEDLKMHTCAQFYKKVSNYTDVEAKEGHFTSRYDFGNNSVKWWTSPSQKGFYNNGDKIWVNDQGPYILEQLADADKWTTFFLPGSPNPPNGTVVKFSKTPKLCKVIDDIQNDLIELEEEIDAIAPSVERGSWSFNASGVVTGKGVFTAYDKPISQAGNPTGLVQSIQSVWIHSTDSSGARHGFTDVKQGQLLEIFVEDTPHYGLFEVVEAHDYTDGAGDYWVIDVNFVRSLEDTTSFKANNLCRFKIFQPPQGGPGAGVVVSDNAPKDIETGQLWFNTRDSELTLYIYYDGVWVPAAPDSPKA
jgi:hypothetical protein